MKRARGAFFHAAEGKGIFSCGKSWYDDKKGILSSCIPYRRPQRDMKGRASMENLEGEQGMIPETMGSPEPDAAEGLITPPATNSQCETEAAFEYSSRRAKAEYERMLEKSKQASKPVPAAKPAPKARPAADDRLVTEED
jgi:hypothetical protein